MTESLYNDLICMKQRLNRSIFNAYQHVGFVCYHLFLVWYICFHGFVILNANKSNEQPLYPCSKQRLVRDNATRLGPHVTHAPTPTHPRSTRHTCPHPTHPRSTRHTCPPPPPTPAPHVTHAPVLSFYCRLSVDCCLIELFPSRERMQRRERTYMMLHSCMSSQNYSWGMWDAGCWRRCLAGFIRFTATDRCDNKNLG